MVVAPGFIDLHSHSGLMIFADPLHEPKVRQGITTEVIGVDGLSYAPIPDPHDLEALAHMNAGLDGRPDIAYDWGSVESYLDRLDELRPSVNLAFLVGNSALRMAAIGWDEVEASEADVANMRSMLREAMEEGAIGLSSGLDYPPGAYASTDELAQLTREAAAHGGFYHTHVRYALGDRYLDPFREAIEIGRRGEGPAHITHFYHRQTFPGGPEPMLALVDDARAEGLDVTFDTYPYEWASTRLLIMIPPWVQAGGPMATKERLADPVVRDRIRRELAERGVLYAGRNAWDDVRLGAFARPELLRWEGRTLGELVRDRNGDSVDVLCDLLLEEDLRVNQVTPGPWTETLRDFIRHPVGMIGTDSTFVGEKPSPRTYGSFPRVLGQFVREEATLEPRRGRPLDDVGRGGAARPSRSRAAPRRVRGRRRRLRPRARPLECHLRRAPSVPRWDRLGGRRRRRGRCEAAASTPAHGLDGSCDDADNRASRGTNRAPCPARRAKRSRSCPRPEPRHARAERPHR